MLDRLRSLFSATSSKPIKGLALYNLTFCPFCIKVRTAMRRMNLNIEVRNADKSKWGNELVNEGGKFQAPCLRIEDPERGVQWLYESNDIIRYLEQRFPKGTT